MIERWRNRLETKYKLIVHGHGDEEARGGEISEDTTFEIRVYFDQRHTLSLVGYGKNRAVQHSSGRFHCFQDAVNHIRFVFVEFGKCSF